MRALDAPHFLLAFGLARERVPSFAEYPFNLPAVRNLSKLSMHAHVTEIEALDSVPGASPPIIDSYGGKSLHEQSHGESFLALVTKRFFGNGLYLLDEPEAALSPTRQLALIARMHELVKQHSQFVIATHSPLLLAYPDATIYSLEPDGIRQLAYEETEHYQITRRFLSDHRALLARLLD